MSPRELVRSTPLRLAGAFALAILLLTGGVFAFVYEATTQAWISRLQTVSPTRRKSGGERRRASETRLVAAAGPRFQRLNFDSLYDPAGTLVFGNLNRKPESAADSRTRYLANFRPTEAGNPSRRCSSPALGPMAM